MIIDNKERFVMSSKKYDFSGYTLNKAKLYKKGNLESIYRCARRFAKSKHLQATKETVSNGIKITFIEVV